MTRRTQRRLPLEGYLLARRAARRAAFMPFVTVGYPSRKETGEVLRMLADNGADCVELGVPFSDPIAEGVTIQHSSQVALERGVGLADVMRHAELAARLGLRVAVMSYANPLLQAGLQSFSRRLRDAGGQGAIVPDLPLEEVGPWGEIFARNGIVLALFAAPTTPPDRLRTIDRLSRGFIYYVSLTGVTGERAALYGGLVPRLRRLRRTLRTPLCVGFGVSTPRQAAAVAAHAEGVIVGSALVRRLSDWAGGAAKRRQIARWAGSVARAVHGAR